MYQPESKFMKIAIQEAIHSARFGEYPVGAVVIKDGKVLTQSETTTHRNEDPTHHAEIIVIKTAARKLKTRKLKSCVLYSTHEPCPMCATAAFFARVDGIVFGTSVKDAIVYERSHLQWTWKWIDIPVQTIAEKSNCKSFIIAHFMRNECQKLFDLTPFELKKNTT